jgi:hypothetical protein
MPPPVRRIRRSARSRLPPQPAQDIFYQAGLSPEQPPRPRPEGIPGNLPQDLGRPSAQPEEQTLVVLPGEPGEDPPRQVMRHQLRPQTPGRPPPCPSRAWAAAIPPHRPVTVPPRWSP